MNKIFQIGFNKCGTKTLFSFFQRNNIPSVHWHGGQLARCFLERRNRGEDPFSDYRNITFFSDMIYLSNEELIEPYRDFEYIHRYYPDSFFILNTRPVEKWIQSRLKHGDWAERYRRALRLKSIEDVIGHWRLAWHEQHFRVLKYFESFPERILLFDIETDQPKKISEFLNKEFSLDPMFYGHQNKTSERLTNKRTTHSTGWKMSTQVTTSQPRLTHLGWFAPVKPESDRTGDG